eukprot:4290737-Pleurochrysis_carterae.AAC.2
MSYTQRTAFPALFASSCVLGSFLEFSNSGRATKQTQQLRSCIYADSRASTSRHSGQSALSTQDYNVSELYITTMTKRF